MVGDTGIMKSRYAGIRTAKLTPPRRKEDRYRPSQDRDPRPHRKEGRRKGKRREATSPNLKGIQILPIRGCPPTKGLEEDQLQDCPQVVHHPWNCLDLAQWKVQRKEGCLLEAARLWSIVGYWSIQVSPPSFSSIPDPVVGSVGFEHNASFQNSQSDATT